MNDDDNSHNFSTIAVHLEFETVKDSEFPALLSIDFQFGHRIGHYSEKNAENYQSHDRLAVSLENAFARMPQERVKIEDRHDDINYHYVIQFQKADDLRPIANCKELHKHDLFSASIDPDRQVCLDKREIIDYARHVLGVSNLLYR